VPVLGPPFELPFEFPLFQAMAAIVMSWGVGADRALRVTSLACFVLTAVLLWLLVRRFGGRIAGAAAVVTFCFSPFGLLWSRTSLIEYLATAAALAWVLAGLRFRDTGRLGWAALATLAGVVAMTVKVTTGAFWVLPLLLYQRGDAPHGAREWVRERLRPGLVALVGIPFVAGAAWTRYADHVRQRNPLAAHTTTSALRDWNFGTLHQRGDGANWGSILTRTDELVAGRAVGLALVLVGLLWVRRHRSFWLGWVLAGVAPVAVFFNLYVVHDYYQAAIQPVVAGRVGLGVDALVDRFAVARPAITRAGVAVAVLGVWAFVALWTDQPYWETADTHITAAGSIIGSAVQLDAVTRPDELVVVEGLDWSPELLYYARREGTMLKPEWVTPAIIAGLRADHHVLVSADPETGDIAFLRQWPWITAITGSTYRMGDDAAQVSGWSPVLATVDDSAVAAARAIGKARLVTEPTTIRCAGGSLDLYGGVGPLWIQLGGGLPDTARVQVAPDRAPLPPVSAIVIAADAGAARPPTHLTCSGTDQVTVVAAWQAPLGS
jgi:hypothetical protein